MQEAYIDVMRAMPKSATMMQTTTALRTKIEYMHRRHAPDKLSRLSDLYQKYDGLEETWLQQLREKYGSTC